MPATVSLSQGPPNVAYTSLNDYNSTYQIYAGVARSFQASAVTLTVVSVSTAGAAVITVTAHGLASDNTVTIAGGTGDWAALNGTHKITVTGNDTFTIPVNSSAFSGSFAGTITTTAPQTGASIWAIQRFYYDGSNNLIRTAWAGGSPSMINSWTNRASLTYL